MWIHNAALADVLTLGPVAGPLALGALAAQRGDPWDREAPCPRPWKVRRRDAGALLGVSRSTLRRHWEEVVAVLDVSPLGMSPRAGAWSDPWESEHVDGQGRPTYTKATAAGVATLLDVARDFGSAAFRVGAWLLREMGAAAARGCDWFPVTLSRVCDAVGLGRSSAVGALRSLESSGAVVFRVGTDGRDAHSRLGRLGFKPGPAGVQTGTAKGSNRDRSLVHYIEESRKEEGQRPRAGDGSVMGGASQAFTEGLPGLSERGAFELSAMVGDDPDRASAWLSQERGALGTVDSPPGWFLACARTGATAPGTKSKRQTIEEGKMREKRPKDVPGPQPVTEEQAATMAAEEAEAEAAMRAMRAEAVAESEEAERLTAAALDGAGSYPAALDALETARRSLTLWGRADPETSPHLRRCEEDIRRLGLVISAEGTPPPALVLTPAEVKAAGSRERIATLIAGIGKGAPHGS